MEQLKHPLFFFLSALINQDPSVLDYFIENIDEVLATILYVDHKKSKADQLLGMVKNRYFQHLSDKKHILKEHEKVSIHIPYVVDYFFRRILSILVFKIMFLLLQNRMAVLITKIIVFFF